MPPRIKKHVARFWASISPTRFWGNVEAKWDDSVLLSWVLIISALGGVLWTSLKPQSPGVSIGILALVAGIMSVRPKMRPIEKFVGVFVLVAFAFLEVRAISKSDQENKEIRDRQDCEFRSIAKGLTDSIAANQRQFEETMARENEIKNKTIEAANLSKENLANVLGRNSYAWITPQIAGISSTSAIPLGLQNYGNHALTGVSIKIIDQEAVDAVFANEPYNGNLVISDIYTLAGTPTSDGKFNIGHELEYTGWSDEGFKGKRLFGRLKK